MQCFSDNEYPDDDDIYMDLDEVESCPPTPAPPPYLTTPTTPAEDLYKIDSAGLFGGPKSPVVSHYRKAGSNPVAPPPTIPEGSSSADYLCFNVSVPDLHYCSSYPFLMICVINFPVN